MGEVAAAIAAEFSDLSAVQAAQLAVRLTVAALVGGLLGWQRAHAGKAAGLWLTAGVGVAAGMGRELSALLLGAAGWFTLSTLARWEARLGLPK